MSVFHPRTLRCQCGAHFRGEIASGIDAGRTPSARQRILDRRLHRFACPTCGRWATAEGDFIYTDLARTTLIRVLPRWDMHRWEAESARTALSVDRVTGRELPKKSRSLRVVFGLEELREKLVAQDAGIDDREIELVKALTLHEHPFLLRFPRMGLHLDEVTQTELRFLARFDHESRRFELSMPREILGARGELRAWSSRTMRRDLFANEEHGDHWVSIRRLAPKQRALALLEQFAEAVREDEPIDVDGSDFLFMLNHVPRGTHISENGKRDLQTLFDYANGMSALQDKLFEIRFSLDLEDDWARNNDPDDIDTLWDLLAALPPGHVEGNSKVDEIELGPTGWGGTYDDQSHDIIIGAEYLAGSDSFENVVRHEFGHAVHEKHRKKINDWLWEEFGWWEFSAEDGIDEWVEMMGGWGTATPAQQRDVKRYLRRALGTQDWEPGPIAQVSSKHPWSKKRSFGPRVAVEKTAWGTGDWYDNFKRWHRHGDYAFFLNYYYKNFSVVDKKTLTLIAKMPSTYAAMSPWEFFAELYALYYDLDDPRRKKIPLGVRRWLKKELGGPS